MLDSRHQREFVERLYPAFSRKATQVVVLSQALEKIERGGVDAAGIARAALTQANPFGWAERVAVSHTTR